MQATDVFVIGGGPAGLAAAIAARRKGLAVTVADGAHPPIDKPCGEGLMPDALAALRQLGVSLARGDGHRFQGIRFLGPGTSAEARFPHGEALGVRRTLLHSRMVTEAAAAGVRLLWDTPVTGIGEDRVHLAAETVAARWIIGADGFSSRVRRWIGLDPGTRGNRFGFRAHYGVAPWSDFMELYWGAGCQIYVTPVSSAEICVAAISRDSHLRLEQALARFPQLAARLAGAPRVTAEWGAATRNCGLPRVYRGRVALIGDASGAVDAITGEGLCLGFQQAIALADCLAADDLAPYHAAHRRVARRPILMARLMLAMDRCAWLRNQTLRALAAEPRVFRKMLALHVGAIPDCIEGT